MRKLVINIFLGLVGLTIILLIAIGVTIWTYNLPDQSDKSLPPVSTVAKKQVIKKIKVDNSAKDFQRNFMVSDIHGRFASLKKALKDVRFTKSDRLFVLGDTIDRGPEGMHALLYLLHDLPNEGYHVVVLTGNHEDMWFQIASNGKDDSERQSNLNGQIDIYEGAAPDGWEESRTEWNKLTENERSYLLNEMAKGFNEPRMLIVKINGKWFTLSHSANFTKGYNKQSVNDLEWYNQMQDNDDKFQQSIAEKLGVPESDVQTMIGHIGGLRFGVHPHYIDLDNTNTMNFKESPEVELYQVETGQMYH
ncbi:MAG TPA: phosphatase [Lactovum miscens]|uniref:phosphatase n=1 Tax=Lactovum miscens TaxID=190387 RepID=UPI002EDAD919